MKDISPPPSGALDRTPAGYSLERSAVRGATLYRAASVRPGSPPERQPFHQGLAKATPPRQNRFWLKDPEKHA